MRLVAGWLAGTPPYMSPELIEEDFATLESHPYACDVYAFAILAWEILTGDRAHSKPEGGMWRLFLRVLKGERPEIPVASSSEASPLAWAWPPRVESMVCRCWAHAASTRPGFGEVVRILQDEQRAFEDLARSQATTTN